MNIPHMGDEMLFLHNSEREMSCHDDSPIRGRYGSLRFGGKLKPHQAGLSDGARGLFRFNLLMQTGMRNWIILWLIEAVRRHLYSEFRKEGVVFA